MPKYFIPEGGLFVDLVFQPGANKYTGNPSSIMYKGPCVVEKPSDFAPSRTWQPYVDEDGNVDLEAQFLIDKVVKQYEQVQADANRVISGRLDPVGALASAFAAMSSANAGQGGAPPLLTGSATTVDPGADPGGKKSAKTQQVDTGGPPPGNVPNANAPQGATK